MFAFFTTLSSWALIPAEDGTLSVYSRAGKMLTETMPRLHLYRTSFDDSVATNALMSFIKKLDFDHTVFFRHDVTMYMQRAEDLDDALASDGDLDIAFDIYDAYMKRLSNRIDYVRQLLNHGFNLDIDETYQWDRDDEAWPLNDIERDEIWRKKIKNQYIGMILAREMKNAVATQETSAVHSDSTNAVVDKQATAPTNTLPETTIEEDILKAAERRYAILRDNDAHWLLTSYLKSFTAIYDPHSEYMSAHNTEDFNIGMKLSLVGIGALLSTADDGAAKIVRIIPGGPAEKDGRLKAGDKIIAVAQGVEDPVDILHWPLSRSVRLIRGEKDTTVVLSVIPASDPAGTLVEKIDLVRDEVKLEDQAAKGEIKQHINQQGETNRYGIITIPDFYSDIQGLREGRKNVRSLTHDVQKILKNFETGKVAGIVIDLRNNGGGALNEAVTLSGLFIPKGPVVLVKTRYKIDSLKDRDPSMHYSGPLVVLVNRLSASASEIFAGAMKDYGRAIIVGDQQTHGKGTVQSLMSLKQDEPELGSLKVTSASFYRINGESTQNSGIQSHIHIPSPLDYMEIGEQYMPFALPSSRIRSTYYREFGNANLTSGTLERLSATRRAENARFHDYMQVLAEHKRYRDTKTISLLLHERRKRAEAEKRLNDLLKNVQPAANEEEVNGEEASDDLIMEESLSILDDFKGLYKDYSFTPGSLSEWSKRQLIP